MWKVPLKLLTIPYILRKVLYGRGDSEKHTELIIIDSTDSIGSGEGLFTIEFYRNCYKVLSQNGI